MSELGKALATRRSQMGLTQSALATLSGLTRQTINQMENGTIGDLSLNRAERLANAVGLTLRVEQPSAGKGASASRRASMLSRAARTASVSFAAPLPPAGLRKILVEGTVPPRHVPHVHALLDDAPVSLLAALAEEMHRDAGMPPQAVWQRFRQLAHQVKSRRDLWQ